MGIVVSDKRDEGDRRGGDGEGGEVFAPRLGEVGGGDRSGRRTDRGGRAAASASSAIAIAVRAIRVMGARQR